MDDPDVVDLTVDDDVDDLLEDEDHSHGFASHVDNPDIFCAELSADFFDLESDETTQHLQEPFDSTILSHPVQQQQAKQTHPSRVKQASKMHQQRIKQQNPSMNFPRRMSAKNDKSKVSNTRGIQQQKNASLYPPRRVATQKDTPSKRSNQKGNDSFSRKRGVRKGCSQQHSQVKSRKRSRGSKRVDNEGRFPSVPSTNNPQQQTQRRIENFQQNRRRPHEGWRDGEPVPSFANQGPHHWVQERRRNQGGQNDRHWNLQETRKGQRRRYEQPNFQFVHREPSFHGAQWQARNGPDNLHWNRNHELHRREKEPRAHPYHPGRGNFNISHTKRKFECNDQDANVSGFNASHDRKRQKTGVHRNKSGRNENFSAFESSSRRLSNWQRNIERNRGSMECNNERLKNDRKSQGCSDKSEQKTLAATHVHDSVRVEQSRAGRIPQSEPSEANGAGKRKLPPDLQERKVAAFISSNNGDQKQHETTRSVKEETSLSFLSGKMTTQVAFAGVHKVEDPMRLCSNESRKQAKPYKSQRPIVSDTVHLDQVCKKEVVSVSQLQKMDTSAPDLEAIDTSDSELSVQISSELWEAASPVSLKESVVYQAHGKGQRADVLVAGLSTKKDYKEAPPITPGQGKAMEVACTDHIPKQETSSRSRGTKLPTESSLKKGIMQQGLAEVNRGEVPVVVCSSGESKPEPNGIQCPTKSLQIPNAKVMRHNVPPAISKEKDAPANGSGSTGKMNVHRKNVAEPLGLEKIAKFSTNVPPKSVDWCNGDGVQDLRSRAMPSYGSKGRAQPGQNDLSSRTMAEACDMGHGRSFVASGIKDDGNTQTVASDLSGSQKTVGEKKEFTNSATVSNRSTTDQMKTETREKNVPPGKNDSGAKPSGQCNFVIIDDSSEEDESEKVPSRQRSHAGTVRNRNQNYASSSGSSKPKGSMQFDFEKNFNYSMSQEAAKEMQERMFREAAARVRTQASFQIPNDPFRPPTFSAPLFDIHKKYPLHWLWKDPYACLGLPPNAPISLAKSQFRRLAREYHPDKSKVANTASKFHSINMAYRKLCEHHERL